MIDIFWELPNKDKITFIGIVITAIASFFNLLISLRLSKRSTYISSITSERINSMTQLKQHTANYISTLNHFIFDEVNVISVEKLYNLKLQIEFQLNVLKDKERLIVQRMDTIYILIIYLNSIKQDITVRRIIEELISKGLDKERIPIPYTEDMLLGIEHAKKYLKKLINIELVLLEGDLKKHIKSEWEKIKGEI